MTSQTARKLNTLHRLLPEGLLVDAAWLSHHSYSPQLRRSYLVSGWLEQPAPRVYQRPPAGVNWQQAVISMQTLLERDLAVGGRSSLEWQGYAHYLKQETTEIYLYGPKKPPQWLNELPTGVRFIYRNDGRLFGQERVSTVPHSLTFMDSRDKRRSGTFITLPWGDRNWPLVLSCPERAVLELLDEIPTHESFHNADMLLEGLTNLSPTRMQPLLLDCRSVKVKRLFFFFADRHQHSWLKHLDREAIDLGRGNRALVKDGHLSPRHLITVPKDFDGVQ